MNVSANRRDWFVVTPSRRCLTNSTHTLCFGVNGVGKTADGGPSGPETAVEEDANSTDPTAAETDSDWTTGTAFFGTACDVEATSSSDSSL